MTGVPPALPVSRVAASVPAEPHSDADATLAGLDAWDTGAADIPQGPRPRSTSTRGHRRKPRRSSFQGAMVIALLVALIAVVGLVLLGV